MASEIEIVATPANGWADTAERAAHERAIRGAAGSQGSLFAVTRYVEVIDLVAKIEAIIQADPDVPCLRSLEIVAHGSPVSCNDLQINESGVWGTELETVNWCDTASIYLSGCNTGLARPRGATPRGPLAEELRDSMRFQSGVFEVRLTVFGTAGFVTGTHAEGNTRTFRRYSTGALWWTVHHEAPAGARHARGNDAWISFQNW